ncbi:MEDS domain-containing protein [Flavobacterium pectinovorum]|uniref:MEDS domain-containing protein n=1 Tax=Flavobacterium pectinovorum TaxID=29533 RepID=UPI00293EA120|nr:MEDS domain-containing protein [Flavobacterium pectinovorum]MCI9845529.1 MEDS domain-containing protein [Flavobacterium pectinovorum]
MKNLPAIDQLLEYELSLNLLILKHSCSMICMYDINSFSHSTITEISLTHPYMIKDGTIVKNPRSRGEWNFNLLTK